MGGKRGWKRDGNGQRRLEDEERGRAEKTWKRDGNFSARIALHSFDPDHPYSPSPSSLSHLDFPLILFFLPFILNITSAYDVLLSQQKFHFVAVSRLSLLPLSSFYTTARKK